MVSAFNTYGYKCLIFLIEKTCFCKSLNIHTNYFYVKYNYQPNYIWSFTIL